MKFAKKGLIFFIALFLFLPFVSVAAQSVKGVKAEDTGRGSILITWDTWSSDYLPIFRKPDKVGRDRYDMISMGEGNIFEDANVEVGKEYEYKVYPFHNMKNPLDPKLEDIETVSAIPTLSRDMRTENLVFVIPESYAKNPNYNREKILSIVNNINYIFAKNTQKQFRLADIKIYPENFCNLSKEYDWCDRLLNDKDFFLPGGISLFYVPLYGTSVGAYPYNIVIQIGNSFDKSKFRLDPNNWIYTLTLVHEIAHTYGAGGPELYFYIDAEDLTQAEPKLNVTNFLPTNYEKDPMASLDLGQEAIFGPLTAYIINNDLDHTKEHDYIYRGFADRIKIKVTDSSGVALSNAAIKSFCIKYSTIQSNKTTPDTVVQTDSNGIATYPPVVTKNPNCAIEIIKIYKEGYKPYATYFTALALQETKILQNKDEYTIEVTLYSKEANCYKETGTSWACESPKPLSCSQDTSNNPESPWTCSVQSPAGTQGFFNSFFASIQNIFSSMMKFFGI